MNNLIEKEEQEGFMKFVIKVQSALEDYYGEDGEVFVRDILKNNGLKLKGVCVVKPGINAYPTLYLESFFRSYQEGETFGNIVSNIIGVIESNDGGIDLDISSYTDYERAKKKLMYRLVNSDNNEELLSGVPYIPYLDLAIVFYVEMFDERNGTGTILVRKEHLDLWGVSVEELYAQARENTPRMNPIKLLSLQEMLSNYGMGNVLSQNSEQGGDDRVNFPIYVVTNNAQVFGASVLLYDDFLEHMRQYMGDTYAIIPSSIHEIIVLPVSDYDEAARLSGMIREVNRLEVAPQEVLSDNPYYYDSVKGLMRAV